MATGGFKELMQEGTAAQNTLNAVVIQRQLCQDQVQDYLAQHSPYAWECHPGNTFQIRE